jgi:oxygen-independent coproporphyrinogen-3 oxidase
VLVETAKDVVETDVDGLVEKTPDGFFVTDRGRPFIRSICAYFDAYLGEGQARHSTGV